MRDVEDFYPLTPMQEGMMFHSLLAPDSGVYLEQFVFVLEGELDVARYRSAWQAVVDRHPILRTSVRWERLGAPVQVVHHHASPPWEVQDWRTLAPEAVGAEFDRSLMRDRDRGFDLARPPLLRFALVRTGARSHRLVLSYHHLILDAWSLSIMFDEVAKLYEAEGGDAVDLAPGLPFRDYVAHLHRCDLDASGAFWSGYLAGVDWPTIINVRRPLDSSSSRAPDHRECRLFLSAETTRSIQELCRSFGLTLNSVVQGAWAVVLSLYSGRRDLTFGITISHRPVEMPRVQDVVGIFINSLPKRVRVDPEERILPWLKSIQADQVRARRFEHHPLADIQRLAGIPAGSPFFETLLIFENFPRPAASGAGSSLATRQERYVGYTNYPLAIEAMPGDHPLYFQVKHDELFFTAEDVAGVLDAFRVVLEGLVDHAEGRLGDIPLVKSHAASGSGPGSLDRAPPRPGRALFEPPEAGREAALAGIWESVLGVERVGRADTFVAVGGDSIRSIRVLSLAQEAGLYLSVEQLMGDGTLADLAAVALEAPPCADDRPLEAFGLLSEEDRALV